MNEAEISRLEDKALVRTFQKFIYAEAIGGETGPFVTIDKGGKILVLLEDNQDEPDILVQSFSTQMVSAMFFLQKFNPHFETTENHKSVYCTLNGTQALGRDYFEAGMKAYLLYMTKQKEAQ